MVFNLEQLEGDKKINNSILLKPAKLLPIITTITLQTQ